MCVRVNAIIITKMLVFLLCKFWTTCTASGVILYESLTTLLNSLVTLYGLTSDSIYRVSQKKGNHLIFRDILFVFKHKRFYAPVNLKCLLTVQL